MKERTYVAIDLKSFYASVECVERGLDPLDVNLVVADESRTEKTICLAVSPALKAYGIPGRARLFEVVQKVSEINAARKRAARGKLNGKSSSSKELGENPSLALDYIIAPPRMAHYMKYSAAIYEIYLKYVSPEDIHVYSIDEVFMDVTDYIKTGKLTANEFARKMMRDVFTATGITATCGIGTNLYLAKVAMDIRAKHLAADANGMRIAELDEKSYRKTMWTHRPLTDFWRVGRGYSDKLEAIGLHTMGDVAAFSIRNEDKLYKLFGVNAELLIDHAWGYEPCTIAEIKAYKPQSNSISLGQVLQNPYDNAKARLVVKEMTDQLVLDLVEKKLLTDKIDLTVGYDVGNVTEGPDGYSGPLVADRYGRTLPKSAHGSVNLKKPTSSTRVILDAVSELFDRITDKSLTVRRMYVVAERLVGRGSEDEKSPVQMDMFTDYGEEEALEQSQKADMEKERSIQETVISIKKKFGKNAIVKGMNMEEGATAMERNNTIGGHKK